ncbi:hypothetical protein A7G45_15205 [Mycolicibacterium llatzerense]|nr:hypothetical protein [Mycolicibacterium llatzerense]MCT7364218.1 hypothetical protein [Mycolicibacterium llatzerense]
MGDLAADIMDETGFGAVLKNLFGFALSMGEGYGMVVPGVKGGATLSSGALSPSIHAIDPRRCIGIPDLSNPVRLRAALLRQFDSITGEYSSHFFLPLRPRRRHEHRRQPLKPVLGGEVSQNPPLSIEFARPHASFGVQPRPQPRPNGPSTP